MSPSGLVQRPLRLVPCSEPFSEAEQPPEISIGSGPETSGQGQSLCQQTNRPQGPGQCQTRRQQQAQAERQAKAAWQSRRRRRVRSRRRSRSSHRLGFDVQQCLQHSGGQRPQRCSRPAAVSSPWWTAWTESGRESQEAGSQSPRPERSSPLRSQGRQQTSQPSCVRTWHRGKGYGSSCRKQGNAEPDCGKRTAEAQALSQKAAVQKHKQVSWSSRGRGQRSARSTPDLRQGQVRAEHQQGAARPARCARRKPDQGRHKAGELPAPQARSELWKPSRRTSS